MDLVANSLTLAVRLCVIYSLGVDGYYGIEGPPPHTFTSFTDRTGRLVLDGCLVLDAFSGLLICGKSCLETIVSVDVEE